MVNSHSEANWQDSCSIAIVVCRAKSKLSPMQLTRRSLRMAVLAVALFAGPGLAWAQQEWLILERTGPSSHPEVVSVLKELPAQPVLAQFPVLLEVKWGYKALPNAMPVEEELARARALYTALDGIIDNHGVHAMTRTGDGGRTLYYYVENAERHAVAIRAFFDTQLPMSVKVTARSEPDWASVRAVLKAIK